MSRSKLRVTLEEGLQVPGMFAPADASFSTPGVLSWSVDEGATLELVDLSDPWPNDFEETFTVHGVPHDGERITLLDARVQRMSATGHPSRIACSTLALGAWITNDETWPRASYRPATLHEWLPETGLSISHPDQDLSRVAVEWKAPERRTVVLGHGEVSVNPSADWAWSYAPGWSIETSMTFGVTPSQPLTMAEHWTQYGNPLLSFAIFAADHPDDLTRESYYDPEADKQVVVIRRGRRPTIRDWRPVAGRYLFQAVDAPDIATALRRWFEVWRKTKPSLGLFAEAISEGNVFSTPRFLTLYTAAEGYWRNTKGDRDRTPWSPKALAERAGVSADVTGATDEALALIGATRRYHAHLAAQDGFSPDDIVGQTYESTRRLHALLQACLMREIGFETADIERLMTEHYRSWPVP